MSNSDPGQTAGGAGQPPQVFCPNCRGGNPPGTDKCMWCGSALPASTAASVGQPTTPYPQPEPRPDQAPTAAYAQPQQPQQPQQTYYQATTTQAQYTPAQPEGSQVNVNQRKGKPVWLWIVLGVVGLCLCVGVGGALTLGGTINQAFQEVSRQLTAVPYATIESSFAGETPEARSTPEEEPTEEVLEEPTEELPLVNPLETVTPVIPEGDLGALGTAEEQAYITAWTDWMQRYGDAFTNFSQHFSEADFTSEEWRSNVQAELDEIASVNAEVEDYSEIPPRFADVHSSLQEAAQSYDSAVGLYSQGIENSDMGVITEANTELQNGTTKLQEAVALMTEALTP